MSCFWSTMREQISEEAATVTDASNVRLKKDELCDPY